MFCLVTLTHVRPKMSTAKKTGQAVFESITVIFVGSILVSEMNWPGMCVCVQSIFRHAAWIQNSWHPGLIVKT